MSKKQKKQIYIIKVSGEVHLSTVDKNDAIKQVENVIEDLEWNTGLEFYLDVDEEVDKITLQLEYDKKLALDISSKAFNMTPKDFIDFVLVKEMNYIENLLTFTHPKEELEDYYEREINIDELKKLILIEEVL